MRVACHLQIRDRLQLPGDQSLQLFQIGAVFAKCGAVLPKESLVHVEPSLDTSQSLIDLRHRPDKLLDGVEPGEDAVALLVVHAGQGIIRRLPSAITHRVRPKN